MPSRGTRIWPLRAGRDIVGRAVATAPRLGDHGPPAHPRGTPTRPRGAEAAHPLRQAGPTAVLVHEDFSASPRARSAPGRRADGVLGRLPPPPAHLLRERRTHGHRERGGVLRDPRHRASRPAGRARSAATRHLPTGARRARGRPGGAGPLADRLEASEWHVVVRGADPQAVTEAVTAYLACEVAETTRTFRPARAPSTRAGRCWPWMPPASTTRGVRYCAWSYGTPHRPCAPMTS